MKDKEQFSKSFREVQPKFTRICSRNLNQSKLTMPQFALLNVLSSAGTIPMTDFSEKLHITKPAVTNLVDRLEKNNYLKRTGHPDDRRISLVQIQPKGKRLVRDMQTTILSFLLTAFEKFDASERQIITRFYILLSETMDQYLVKNEKSRKAK